MSKIGRKLIDLQGATVEINGQEISYKGAKASGVHILPEGVKAELVDNKFIQLTSAEKTNENNRLWGLHRALLANEIQGATRGFEKNINIVGLGFKAIAQGRQLDLSLGYSHKIKFDLPAGITVDIDKTGQNLVVKGSNRETVGQVCGSIRSLRPPEPYKGTGIKVANEHIIRKAGKTKAAA